MELGTFLYNGWTNALAQAIALWNPTAAARYMTNRRRFLSYKAARRNGPNRNWLGDRNSADATIRREWRQVVSRARDLAKNSPYVSGAIEKICDNVVFNGIRPQFTVTRGDTLDRERARTLERLFKRWAKAVGNTEKQELGIRHLWMDGGYFIHYFVDTDLLKKGLPPLNYELLELDHLDRSVDGLQQNGTIARQGIEYNKRGKAVAYHLFPEHPGDNWSWVGTESRRVLADTVEHVFTRKRISQSRGISWLASIIVGMHNFDEYQDSEQIAMRLLSAFAFFVETPFSEVEAPLGGVSMNPESGADPSEALRSGDFVEPGQVVTVPTGSKVHPAGYDKPGANYEPWTKSQLRGGSAGMGVSYETFTGDLTETTYSGGRQGLQVERRAYQRQQGILNRKHNDPVIEKWLSFVDLTGLVDLADADVETTHLCPGWPWVDPRNDAQCARIELEMGVTTLTKLCADRGLDFEEVVERRVEEIKFMKERGLIEEEQHGSQDG
tara:strand:- start:2862 stop:4352 length:1491 start_codon:yes stop_codon:yes gene_type:complete